VGPAERRDEEDDDAREIERVRAVAEWPDQEDDTGEADPDADEDEPREGVVEVEPAQDREPEGDEAMRIAAIPDGTVSSASPTKPLPIPRRSVPTIAESRHSRAVGSRNDRPDLRISQAKSTAPAIANRIASMRNGGIVSMAIAMPR
jgi:hypothetical protein